MARSSLNVPGSFDDARREAAHLLALHPELAVAEEYSLVTTPYEQRQDYSPFRRAGPDMIVEILGYWWSATH